MIQSAPNVFGLFELDLTGKVMYSKIDAGSSSNNLPVSLVGLNFFDEVTPFALDGELRRRFRYFVKGNESAEKFVFTSQASEHPLEIKVMLTQISEREYDGKEKNDNRRHTKGSIRQQWGKMLNNLKSKTNFKQENLPLDLDVRATFAGKSVGTREKGNWNIFSKEISPAGNHFDNRLLAALPVAVFERFTPHLRLVSLASGEEIYRPSDVGEFLYFPETAVFSQLNILEDGRTCETAMIGNEGVAGLSTLLCVQPKTCWTQTLIAGSALRINRRIFKQEFAGSGFLQAALFDYLNYFIAQISQKAICSNYHRIEERFSSWLLMLGDRAGKNNMLLTHDQIAHILGVHRPSLSCIAQDLRDKGIIGYVRGRIIVSDRRRLESSACECYQVLKR